MNYPYPVLYDRRVIKAERVKGRPTVFKVWLYGWKDEPFEIDINDKTEMYEQLLEMSE